VDVSWFTSRKAPRQYSLVRYRFGSVPQPFESSALFSIWSFENSDCSETQTPFSNNRLASCEPVGGAF
jgi:hypothetical protein